MNLPDVPSVDDCDYLFTATTRDGKTSIYLRLQSFEWEKKQWFAGAITWDCDKSHNCCDLETGLTFRYFKQAAFYLRDTAREHLPRNNYCFCENTRKYLA